MSETTTLASNPPIPMQVKCGLSFKLPEFRDFEKNLNVLKNSQRLSNIKVNIYAEMGFQAISKELSHLLDALQLKSVGLEEEPASRN